MSKMQYEENYMTYIENEGCCSVVTCKLRKKRHLITIIVLLILAILSLVAGMYNGLTIKKYSNLSLVVGIFFPSIILIFVCLYLAFICGRESFRSSVLSRDGNSSCRNHSGHTKDGNSSGKNNSHHIKDDLQYPQTNLAICEGMKYQFKVNTDFANNPVATVKEESPFNQVHYTKNDSTDYCEAKISRRHFRSYSNSDISSEMSQSHNALSKKSEISKVSYRKTDENQCSPEFLEHHNVVHQHRGFKRSVSDTTNRKKNTKLREDRGVRNTRSLQKLRNSVDRLNSVQDAEKETCCKPSSEVRRKQTEDSFLRSNFKSTVEYGNRTGFKEDGDCDQRHTRRQGKYVSPQEDVEMKSCYTKSEIRLYSSNVPSYKYKQTLKISSFQPDIKDNGDAVCSSLNEDENSSISLSDILKMKRKKMENKRLGNTGKSWNEVSSSLNEDENGSISLSDILKMERRKMENKRLGNSTSEQDAYRLRRKTLYFPSTSSESTRSSKEYAHEYCRYSNTGNKMKHQLPSRNEEHFGKPESNKQIRFHKR